MEICRDVMLTTCYAELVEISNVNYLISYTRRNITTDVSFLDNAIRFSYLISR